MEIVVPEEFRHLYAHGPEMPVVKIPDPVLRRKAAEVVKYGKKQRLLIEDMIRIMKKSEGIGLAAPQVGLSTRIVVVAPHGVKAAGFINPVIVKSEGEVLGEEGCLSIPALYGQVKRAEYIEVEAIDQRGREVTLELEGIHARVMQHEIDHLDGILFTDRAELGSLYWRDPHAYDEE